MPETGGLTATRIIRELGVSLTYPPIVAFAADAMAGNREEFISTGMDGSVSKPFDPRCLHATIARRVGGGPEVPPVSKIASGGGNIAEEREDPDLDSDLMDAFVRRPAGPL